MNKFIDDVSFLERLDNIDIKILYINLKLDSQVINIINYH